MNKLEQYKSAIGLAVGLVGIGWAMGTHSKMNALCKKLDTSIDTLMESGHLDIPEALIQESLNRAVTLKADSILARAKAEALANARAETEKQVKSALNKEYYKLQESVKSEIAAQVRGMDISELRDEVKAEAKVKLAENMDDILQEFNGSLENISKIYGSIANTMTGQHPKETVFKIS